MSSRAEFISSKPLSPDISKISPNFKKYLPTFKPLHNEVHLKNIPQSMGNALRRTMMSELQVKALDVRIEDIETNDVYILSDMIRSRLGLIPILQSISINTCFSLNVTNNTPNIIDVYTDKISYASKHQYFDHTYCLFSLNPGKYVHIKDIHIAMDYGYNFAGFSIAWSCVLVPLDETLYDPYTGEGVKSSISNPQNHKLIFDTYGTESPKDIFRRACEQLIKKLENIKSKIKTIEKNGKESKIILKGENDTLGVMIIQAALKIRPELRGIKYQIPITATNELHITCKSDEFENILRSIIPYCTEKLNSLISK